VEFFQNNTFATIAGMGASTILRGKFNVIGDKKDQLWMQIWRFGFGRSVSGSVYSEGTYLSKDDEKTYWGRIEYVTENERSSFPNDQIEREESALPPSNEGQSEKDDNSPRLLVKGSVIFGGNGLEPQPIGRFILTERTTSPTDGEDEEEEEEEEEGDNPSINLDGTNNDDQSSVYNNDDAFQ
jgi:hypothetical protein